MASEYYFQKNGQEYGPVGSGELRRMAATGELLPTDQLRKSDMDRWVKASALKGLFPAAEGGQPSPAPAPAAKKPPLAKPQAVNPAPLAAKAPAPKPSVAKPRAAAPAAAKPVPGTVASKPGPARIKAPVAIAPDTEEEESDAPAPTPKPASRGVPRWVWFAVIGVVVVAAGGGGVYLYILHQANKEAELEARAPMPAQAPADQSPPDPLLADMQSDKPLVRAVAFSNELKHGVDNYDREQIDKIVRSTLADEKFSDAWEDALLLMSAVGSPQDVDLLKTMAAKDDVDTRCAAMSTLLLLAPDAGLPMYESHAGDMKYGRVIDALNHAGPRCVPAALAMLKSRQPACRLEALDLLTAYGSKPTRDAIKKAEAAETDPKLASKYDAAIKGISARMK